MSDFYPRSGMPTPPSPRGVTWAPPERYQAATPRGKQLRPLGAAAVLLLSLFGMVLTGLLFLLLFTGCSVVRIANKTPAGQETTFTAYVPGWPWQDSAQVLAKMNLSAKTNAFTASLRDLSESETTSTNAAALVNGIVNAAVSAAVKATVKP